MLWVLQSEVLTFSRKIKNLEIAMCRPATAGKNHHFLSFQAFSCDGGGAGLLCVAAVLLAAPGDQGLPAGDHAPLRAPAGLLRRARGRAQDHGRRCVRITFSVFSFVAGLIQI